MNAIDKSNAIKRSKAAAAKRRRRRQRGLEDEAAARDWSKAPKPSEGQLVLPLLALLERRGGQARPSEIYDEMADAVGLDPSLRDTEVTFANGRRSNLWDRQVRWARETAKKRGLVTSPERGLWALTEAGAEALGEVKPGVVVTVFTTDSGESWWARAEDAVGMIAPGSVDMIFTSPPYPLLVDKRKYGTMSVPEWLDWMFGLAGAWRQCLNPKTGSLVLNLGPVGVSGQACQSPYIERITLALVDELGYRLMDRMYWHNPTRMPPMEWVSKRRVRCRPSVEPILWFTRGDLAKSDNSRVLEPYKTDRWQSQTFDGIRPSGFDLSAGKSFAMVGDGRIPNTLIEAPNCASNAAWRRRLKAAGLPAHPAVMPDQVAELVIKLITEPGDLVYDPFLGSGTTAVACERSGRQWLGSDRSFSFVRGQAVRIAGEVAA